MPSRAHPFVAFSLALTTSLVAQGDPKPAPSLLPLHENARWTYDVERRAAATEPARQTTLEVVDEGGFSLPELGRVHQLRTIAGSATSFECWSVRDDGIYLHRVADPARRGTLDVDSPPIRILALPGGEAAMEQVTVPAGEFRAVRVRMPGAAAQTRDLWFAPGTGIVREELRDGERHEVRHLKAHAAGRDTRREVLLAHLEEQLRNPANPPYNMTPAIIWVEPIEAMLMPGRIAVVKAETWTSCFYVDGKEARAFDYRNADGTAYAAALAFGTKTSAPPDSMPLRSLALLIARTHAARCGLGNAREAEPTILPQRKVPSRGRTEHVELIGGGNDGTVKRVAVWLTIDRSSEIQVVSDAEPPGKML